MRYSTSLIIFILTLLTAYLRKMTHRRQSAANLKVEVLSIDNETAEVSIQATAENTAYTSFMLVMPKLQPYLTLTVFSTTSLPVPEVMLST